MATPSNELGLPAGGWEPYFQRAQVETEKLESAKSARAKATAMGGFLARNVGREVPIASNNRTGRAKLCAREGHGRQKFYHFEITWDAATPDEVQTQAAAAPPSMNDGHPISVPTRDVEQCHPGESTPTAQAAVNGPCERTTARSSSGNGNTSAAGNSEVW